MDKIRQGEIALALMREQVASSGIPKKNDLAELKSRLSNRGVRPQELHEFFKILAAGLVDEAFGASKQSELRVVSES